MKQARPWNAAVPESFQVAACVNRCKNYTETKILLHKIGKLQKMTYRILSVSAALSYITGGHVYPLSQLLELQLPAG